MNLLSRIKEQKKIITAMATVIFVLLVVIAVLSVPVFAYTYRYADRVYQGVEIDGIPVGGLTAAETAQKLNGYVDKLKQDGIPFHYATTRKNIDPVIYSSTEQDVSREILFFDVDRMVQSAFAYGRKGFLVQNLAQQLRALLNPVKIPLQYSLREDDVRAILHTEFGSLEQQPKNASVRYTAAGTAIVPEQDGHGVDYADAISRLRSQMDLRQIESVPIRIIPLPAQITKADIEKNPDLIRSLVELPDLVITATVQGADRRWVIPSADVRSIMQFEKTGGDIKLSFDPEQLRTKLAVIQSEVIIPAREAKFVMTDGKVTEFEPSVDGSEADLDVLQQRIQSEYIAKDVHTFAITMHPIAPRHSVADLNQIGIRELLATGVSDFAGSSTARVHNIRTATDRLDGIIIAPGEEFSLVDELGDIDGENGYVPEYVIKDNKTQKEYGGGLCQIGTTMFRGALRAGLPITERRNHSYIVAYYYPTGTDATIYGPHPDLRFMNDTPGHIVIQTKMVGTKLYYEFWGTSDGRSAEVTDPVALYNVKQPPAPKLIETLELKPGVKRCSEKARIGGDTHFYRYITTPDGAKKEEIFRSHYRPWGEVCEIGVEKLTVPESPPTVTSPDGAAASQQAQ